MLIELLKPCRKTFIFHGIDTGKQYTGSIANITRCNNLACEQYTSNRCSGYYVTDPQGYPSTYCIPAKDFPL